MLSFVYIYIYITYICIYIYIYIYICIHTQHGATAILPTLTSLANVPTFALSFPLTTIYKHHIYIFVCVVLVFVNCLITCQCTQFTNTITCQCTQFTNTRTTHTHIYIYKHVPKHLSDCYTTTANSNAHDDKTLHQTTTHCATH